VTADPKITSSVIQPVSVFVINLLPFMCPNDQSVHCYEPEFAIIPFDLAFGIDTLVRFNGAPIVFA